MEEVVKRHILESIRGKYHRAGKLAKGELFKEAQLLLGCHLKHAIPASGAADRGQGWALRMLRAPRAS
jgi:hypothetical protein